MDVMKRFQAFVKTNDLVRKGDRVLLAVSGGLDSVVLMDLFHRLQPQWHLRIAVAHMNHGLRGRAADRDEAFVGRLCRERGIPFFSRKVNVKRYTLERRMSPEEGARDARFSFLVEILNRQGFHKVATGHHADDQAETILMRLLQGSGLRGLAGMRPKRDGLIHPLLFASRLELSQYAEKRGLPFMEDATNWDRTFLRNRLRHDVLRSIEKSVGPHAVGTINRAGRYAQEADLFLDHCAKEALGHVTLVNTPHEIVLDIHSFLHYFRAVQKRVIIRCLESILPEGRGVRSSEIERLLDLVVRGVSGAKVELDGNAVVQRSGNTVAFVQSQKKVVLTQIDIDQWNVLPGAGIRLHASVRLLSKDSLDFAQGRNREVVDYDKLRHPLVVRSFQEGDWFIPLGMKGKKKLHDFFIDEKIPVYQRSSVPLLVSGDRIVWVVGHRIDDRFKVDKETECVLELIVERIELSA